MTEPVIDKIDLGKFSDLDREAIEGMQGEIDLASTVAITAFCNVSSASAGIEALSAAMEQAPTSLLAGKIAEIVAKLEDADPRVVAEKPSWMARITGAALEGKVRYQVSRKAVDTLIEEADRLSVHVVSLIGKLEEMMVAHADQSHQLELKMVAGKLYLERHPEAGRPPEGEISFDNPRERFSRRLASMAALFSSNEMSLTQMKLTRVQAIDMVERFHEISSVLVPVWRQHTMALVSSLKNSPEAIAVAAKAHESLMTSLSALKGSAR